MGRLRPREAEQPSPAALAIGTATWTASLSKIQHPGGSSDLLSAWCALLICLRYSGVDCLKPRSPFWASPSKLCSWVLVCHRFSPPILVIAIGPAGRVNRWSSVCISPAPEFLDIAQS